MPTTATPLHRRLVGQIAVNVVPLFLVAAVIFVIGIVAYEVKRTLFPSEAKAIQERMDKAHKDAAEACDDPGTRCDPKNRGDELEKFLSPQLKAEPQTIPVRR